MRKTAIEQEFLRGSLKMVFGDISEQIESRPRLQVLILFRIRFGRNFGVVTALLAFSPSFVFVLRLTILAFL